MRGMREIKFRAWLRQENRMAEVYTINFQGYPISKCAGVYVYSKQANDFVPVIDFDLMQYTGLKDKNGKEIYEGDILVIPCRRILDPSDLATNEVTYVFFLEGSFLIDRNDCLYDYNLDAEVVGNIYENQNLLV